MLLASFLVSLLSLFRMIPDFHNTGFMTTKRHATWSGAESSKKPRSEPWSKRIKVLSYNIDGLNMFELNYRTQIVLSLIVSEEPTIIQLQEVVPSVAALIDETLLAQGYGKHDSTIDHTILSHYYTMTYIKSPATNQWWSTHPKRVAYTGEAVSSQGRDMLVNTLPYGDSAFLLVNSHLESCGTAMRSPGSSTRQAQLCQALQRIRQHNGPAIVTGDFNIRDAEAKSVIIKFPDIIDIAEYLNAQNECTWFLPGKPMKGKVVKYRFDRIYFNRRGDVKPVSYKLIGGDNHFNFGDVDSSNVITATYPTVLDHRGIVVEFK